MSDRPTPRTDEVNCEDGLPLESRYDKMHDLAEELERELAEIRETIADPDFVEIAMICGLIAIPDRGEFNRIRELAEVRGQRDRLAEALRACMPLIGKPGCPAEWIWADDDMRDKSWRNGQSALAALEGGAE